VPGYHAQSTLTVQQMTDLAAGNTYFNVHSNNNLCAPAANCANGEIRGQIGKSRSGHGQHH
jgi:hypothetical protein